MWDISHVETSYDRKEVAEFLQGHDLHYDEDSEVTVELRKEKRIVATGSLKGNVLQCFAVAEEVQGGGLSNKIVNHLIQVAFERGHSRVFVFTAPKNVFIFKSMGFIALAETPWAALMESGFPSIEDYKTSLAAHAVSAEKVGGLVMNCNPFTLGHKYLVEQAASACGHVFLLVVEEDRSVFPYAVRMDLVKKGVAHLNNVTVLSSGPYAVSLATFPSYFSAEETAHARAGASIDAVVYAKHIASTLGIKTRFVGTEPYSLVTAIYNSTMRQTFKEFGIELVEIPRLEHDGRAVSASLVRQALRDNDYALLASLVPASTLDFITSAEAKGIIAALKKHSGRH